MDTDTDYRERLARAMKLSGITIHQLADDLEVTYQAIKKVLAGTSKALTAANTFRAARLMGIDAEWLATGLGSPRSARSWPISAQLQEAWTRAAPEQRRVAENAARNVLGLDPLPRVLSDSLHGKPLRAV
jgi:transcriptional regulator with XRE-family HTH domain